MAETKALKKLRGDEKIMADQARRIAELQAALTALLRHWRMGLPAHDMEDLFDAAEKALEKKS